MNNDDYSVKTVITFGGAFIAFLIGSGFATGQEVLQYFTSYGYRGIAGAVLTLILLLFVGVSFITVGQEEKFERSSDIFRYYCGDTLGGFFDYFATVFIYLSFVVMIAGAGATVEQHFGLPVYVGGVLMALMAGFTVSFGLGRIVDVIGRIGPTIVVISIGLGLVSIFGNFDGIARGQEALPTMNIMKASSNWIFAAGSYVGFCMLWLASFLAAMGATAKSRKEAAYGAGLGAIGFSLAVIVVALGLLAYVKDVAASQIPMLILAEKVHPMLANGFSLIIVAGIYTTAVPLLWSVSSRIAEDKSPRFRTATIILAVAGLVVGIYLPFARLVNIVYVINGYVGILLLGIMVLKSFRQRVAKA
ncbi:hypothetical protein L2W58_04100 [Dethiosulfovibrio sp. F2B]|uniref:YkvI family membrane protein n=1 Tax=Dethiosulfovibrio faecalis TaxID=2720018 RepID=UPI001F458487|nr:hypothetical protein [Dethiosulfovibrio faecalis]MCF4150975.1 hypothetical protein [Dethiosulfovibrio faecalis]